jgi:hypothetical protein
MYIVVIVYRTPDMTVFLTNFDAPAQKGDWFTAPVDLQYASPAAEWALSGDTSKTLIHPIYLRQYTSI